MMTVCASSQAQASRLAKLRQLLIGRDRRGRCKIKRAHFSQGALVLSNRRSLSVGGNGWSSSA